MTLLAESINTFINPVEASALAHQPIKDRTYFAAKFTYLAVVVGYVVFLMNVVPVLAGLLLKNSRWFYPVSYAAALYLFGIVIALMTCALIGLLFRVVPTSRLRSIGASAQIAVFLMLFVGPRIAPLISRHLPAVSPVFASANPLLWFVSLALILQGPSPMILGWPAILSMLISSLFVMFGIRSLSEGYMTRVHLLLRSVPGGRRASKGRMGRVVRLLTGRPSGRAAFQFIYSMVRTDWQFRRTVVLMLVQFLLIPLIGIVRGLGHSPFAPGPPTAVHFLPHISGLAGLSICTMLTYSDQYKAAWIFLTAPLDGIQSFVRGIFWALWIPFTIVPLLLVPLFIWSWGLIDGLLFAAYCVAVGSFYLSVELFLLDGLPFANPPRQGAGMLAAPLIAGALIGAAIIVGLQWLFIFQSRLVTFAAGLAFAGGAYLIAKVSLGNLQTNVVHNLHVIASGRSSMFKELE
jgi:ABC-2 type transport system permease protein